MESQIRRYRVMHRTHYEYSSQSSLCHNQAHLQPRDYAEQHVIRSNIEIDPKPAGRSHWLDSFGNHVEFFSIEELHGALTVTSTSTVERLQVPFPAAASMNWSFVRRWIDESYDPINREAREFLFDSRYCQSAPEFESFVSDLISDDFDFLDVVRSINNRIYRQFRYSPNSTHVTTRPIDVLRKRCGVCQDFAHVMISCFRSVGIPARYVSGYLLTQPPPGKPKLVGADASHAWISVFAGPLGWIDLDPTNNLIPSMEHITVAWGRDYADVAPFQGVFVGGGFTTLLVSVDVSACEE